MRELAMNAYSSYSAVELSQMVKDGAVSSTELVEVAIADIENLNPSLNAVVATRFKEARAEASAADVITKQTPREELPAFHGVPCSIKEAFALKGMPNSSGVLARKHIRSTNDATAVARLRAAGAIPLGVTNTSEACMWMESNNPVYGLTRNPYDRSRTVGGSSGGEGAVVGAGIVPFGLGSDVGGSIRMPAFFNGVFGHKPSGGLIPNTGQFPVGDTAQGMRYVTTGPLCRFSEDLEPLVRILAGTDGKDPGCRDIPFRRPDDVDIKGRRVVVIPGNTSFRRASAELIDVQRRAADELSNMGAAVEEVQVPELDESLMIWAAMLGDSQITRFAQTLGIESTGQLLLEVLRKPFGLGNHTLPALMLALIDTPLGDWFQNHEKFIAKGQKLRAQLEGLMGDGGVILYPPHAVVAPRHHHAQLTIFNWVYTAILNVMEFPVTQTPLGLNPRGLPLGVQVVGAFGQDHVTIAVAKRLEQAMGGWVGPSGR